MHLMESFLFISPQLLLTHQRNLNTVETKYQQLSSSISLRMPFDSNTRARNKAVTN